MISFEKLRRRPELFEGRRLGPVNNLLAPELHDFIWSVGHGRLGEFLLRELTRVYMVVATIYTVAHITSSWTPKVYKMIAFWGSLRGFGPFFHRLLADPCYKKASDEVTEEGHSVLAHIHGFEPYFFVECPQEMPSLLSVFFLS